MKCNRAHGSAVCWLTHRLRIELETLPAERRIALTEENQTAVLPVRHTSVASAQIHGVLNTQ